MLHILMQDQQTIRLLLVYEMFKRDFDLFKYSFSDPTNKIPIGEMDLDEIHTKLSGTSTRFKQYPAF